MEITECIAGIKTEVLAERITELLPKDRDAPLTSAMNRASIESNI